MARVLRFATPDDAAAIHAIYAPFVRESAITFELEAPSVAAVSRRIETTLARHPWLVSEGEDGSVTGFAYASALRTKAAYQWTVETTIYLAAGARGQGLGRRLYAALFDVLRHQGHVWAYACLTRPHEGSEAFHGAMGFEHVATFERVGYKLGRWWDVGWWRKALCVPAAEPASPTPLPAVRDQPAVQQALTERGSSDA